MKLATRLFASWVLACSSASAVEQPTYSTPRLDMSTLKVEPDAEGWVHYLGLSFKGPLVKGQPHGEGLCKGARAYQKAEPCAFRHGQRIDATFLARTGASIEQQRMNDELQAIADAERERLAREERRREDEQMAAAFMSGVSTLGNELQQAQVEQAERQAAIDAAVARGRAEYEARQAREARERAEQKAAVQAASASTPVPVPTTSRPTSAAQASKPRPPSGGTGSWETSGAPRSAASGTQVASAAPSKSKLIETPEAITVCTIPDAEGRFRCDTPVDTNLRGGPKSSLPEDRTPDAFIASHTASCPEQRRLPSTTHRVWGCGFGATNNSAQRDRSAGVDVKGRRTYYCYEKETSCRRTTP